MLTRMLPLNIVTRFLFLKRVHNDCNPKELPQYPPLVDLPTLWQTLAIVRGSGILLGKQDFVYGILLGKQDLLKTCILLGKQDLLKPTKALF
jgi:hypothetical protein